MPRGNKFSNRLTISLRILRWGSIQSVRHKRSNCVLRGPEVVAIISEMIMDGIRCLQTANRITYEHHENSAVPSRPDILRSAPHQRAATKISLLHDARSQFRPLF